MFGFTLCVYSESVKESERGEWASVSRLTFRMKRESECEQALRERDNRMCGVPLLWHCTEWNGYCFWHLIWLCFCYVVVVPFLNNGLFSTLNESSLSVSLARSLIISAFVWISQPLLRWLHCTFALFSTFILGMKWLWEEDIYSHIHLYSHTIRYNTPNSIQLPQYEMYVFFVGQYAFHGHFMGIYVMMWIIPLLWKKLPFIKMNDETFKLQDSEFLIIITIEY